MMEGPQRVLTHVFFETAQIGQDFGRIARDAQAGGQHQKRQDGEGQEKGPGVVDVDFRFFRSDLPEKNRDAGHGEQSQGHIDEKYPAP